MILNGIGNNQLDKGKGTVVGVRSKRWWEQQKTM